MKKAILALGLICSIFLSGPAFATDFYWSGGAHPGTLVTKNLNIDAYLPWSSGGSARAMGMGGAFTAVASDLGGAVEYNPAGLTQLGHLTVSALAIARRNTEINATGKKTSKWNIVPTQAGAALRVGPLAVAISRKQPEGSAAYKKFSRVQNGSIRAPDGYPMSYDTYSDTLDTKDLNTIVLTGAIKLSRLSIGANYNRIKGDIVHKQRGRISTQEATWYTGSNNRFDTSEKVNFEGYTMDAGALMNMGPLRLAVAAKNFKGNVDLKRNVVWQDNFAMGNGNTWNWVSPTLTENITKFAPTYTAGAALVFGKILTVDLDYTTIKLEDSKKSQARLGAELAVIPGFLFARGGLKTDLKNKIEGLDNKTNEYFIGAGLKMLVLTVDASASLAQAKAGSAGDNMSGGISATLKF